MLYLGSAILIVITIVIWLEVQSIAQDVRDISEWFEHLKEEYHIDEKR